MPAWPQILPLLFPDSWPDLQDLIPFFHFLADGQQRDADACALRERARQAAAEAAYQRTEARLAYKAGQRAARARLEKWLTPEQQHDLIMDGVFRVPVPSGNRWAIHATVPAVGNVRLRAINSTAPFAAARAPAFLGFYCAHPRQYTHAEDAWLAQALTLKHDEAGFLSAANYYSGD